MLVLEHAAGRILVVSPTAEGLFHHRCSDGKNLIFKSSEGGKKLFFSYSSAREDILQEIGSRCEFIGYV